MDPALRELLDHSKFHQGAARAVAALLPPGDDALAALLDETCAAADPLGFQLVVSTALDAGRTVDAACLRRGLGFCNDAPRLACLAWKMTGDVPGAILAALTEGRVNLELHAAALFIVAAWCAERRGGELPAGFAANARQFARHKEMRQSAAAPLHAAALWARDEGFLAVLRETLPPGSLEAMRVPTENYGRALLVVAAGPAMALIPAEPPSTLVSRQPIQRAVEKLGRNDPCHCGSGREYKRCCFEKDRERLTFSSEVAGLTQAELRAVPGTALTEGRLKAMMPLELARLDPRKLPPDLLTTCMMQCAGLVLFERLVECFEVLEWGDDDHDREQCRLAANFVSFFVVRDQRQDIAARLLASPPVVRLDPPYVPRDSIRLLMAREDPAAALRVIDEIAVKILHETDADELNTLTYSLLCSPHTALGLLVCRAVAVLLPRKDASFLHERILEARDKLDFSPDDPITDLLEKRLAEETSDEGADAARLREARQRLDHKAAEVRALKEEIDHQRRKLDRQERAQRERAAAPQPAPVSPAPTPAEDAALREGRAKLAALKGTLSERAAERIALRQELEKAHDALEALRRDSAAAPGRTLGGTHRPASAVRLRMRAGCHR